MAINNNLKGDLSNLQNTVKDRDQLKNVVNDTLFGLFTGQADKTLIADVQLLNQLIELQDADLDFSKEIDPLKTNITNRLKQNTIPAEKALKRISYSTGDIAKVNWTIQKITAEESRLKINKSSIERSISQKNSELAAISAKWSAGTTSERDTIRTALKDLNDVLDKVDTDLAESTRVMPLLEQLLQLRKIEKATESSLGKKTWPAAWTRHHELAAIIQIMKNAFCLHDASKYVPKLQLPAFTLGKDFPIPRTPPFSGGNKFDLSKLFIGDKTHASYELCDTNGQELTKEGGNDKRKVTLVSGETVTLKGVSIDATNNLVGQNITIDPIENIKFPATIEIQVRWRIQEPHTGILIDNYKPLTLTINAPVLSQSDREKAYDTVNNALGSDTIQNRLRSTYTANNKDRENAVVRDILRQWDNKEEVDKVFNNPKLKELLEERLRGIPGLVPVFPVTQLVTWFKTHMSDVNKQVPTQYLTDINAFTDYIRNNMEKNIQDYLKEQVKDSIEKRWQNNWVNNRDKIISTFLEFQTDVANNKLDNNDHMQILQNLPTEQPQGQPNGFFHRLFGRRSNRNNYTKFFVGKTAEVDNQEVEMHDNTIKYGIKLHVAGVNKISASINIDGEDEPLIIDAANHTQLIQAILSRASTKSWEPMWKKARCHMAVSAIKALVKMSPVWLHRAFSGQVVATDRNSHNVDRLETVINNDNLIMRANCISQNVNHTRTNRVIFDEARFKSMHNVDELENGVNALSTQINGIMNSMADEFRTATSRIKPGPLMKYNTWFPLRMGRAKRLYGKLRYKETNYDFDFSTSVNSWDKSVNIKFEKGKFTVSGTHKDKLFELTNTNLGAILRKVKSKDRLFDGIELDIVERVNEEIIQKLRKNVFISSENFVVSDLNPNKTWRVYIFDSSGELSYLDIEDRVRNPLNAGKSYGTIREDHLPPHRIRCNAKERKEFMQNPLLGWRLVRSMRLQLALF